MKKIKHLFSKGHKNQDRLVDQPGNPLEGSTSDQKRGIFIIILLSNLLALFLLIGFAFTMKQGITLIKQFSQVSIAREAELLSTLHEIASQIAVIKADHQSIAELKTELSQLKQTMATEQSLSGLAKSAELQQMAIQLKQLRQTLHRTRSPHRHKKQLKKSAAANTTLPFTVQSIDSIAGQPFASVLYHQETLPIRLNDSLAGWKAVQLELGAGMAVWENAQRRRIKIMASRSVHE